MCSYLCNIFCCFGCLTLCGCRDRVTRRLVFFPPPPTYQVEEAKEGGAQTMWLLSESGQRMEPYSAHNFKFQWLQTKRRNRIASLWIECEGSTTTLLFSHGNATDLGCMRDHFLDLSTRLRVNLFAYDYSGYGLSTGHASATNCCADILAAYQHVRTQHPLACKRLILYGQSLGSGPSLYLASLHVTSGLIIHSGLLSCIRVLDPTIPSTPFYDLFPNIDLIPHLISSPPVFILHGAADAEIPPLHAQRLYDSIQGAKYPMWLVSGCGHNDVEVRERAEYWRRMEEFVDFVKQHVEEVELVERAEEAKKRDKQKQTKWCT